MDNVGGGLNLGYRQSVSTQTAHGSPGPEVPMDSADMCFVVAYGSRLDVDADCP